MNQRNFYIHPESGSAFVSEDGPEIVCEGEPCCEWVDYPTYHRACCEWGVFPEPEDIDLKDIIG